MFNLFAHAGELHEPAPPPTFFETFEGFMFLNIAPFVVLVLMLLVFNRVWHVKQSVQLAVTLVYLLVVGLLSYRYIPIASIISLVAGFGLSLAWVILPFKKR